MSLVHIRTRRMRSLKFIRRSGSIEHLLATFDGAGPECQYAQTGFALALVQGSDEGHRQQALPILRRALHSPYPETIALACTALPLLRDLDQALSAGTLAIPTLVTLLEQSHSAEAKSAAIRAIGVVAKESDPPAIPPVQRCRAIEALADIYSTSMVQPVESLVDQNEALWALANLCDGLTPRWVGMHVHACAPSDFTLCCYAYSAFCLVTRSALCSILLSPPSTLTGRRNKWVDFRKYRESFTG